MAGFNAAAGDIGTMQCVRTLSTTKYIYASMISQVELNLFLSTGSAVRTKERDRSRRHFWLEGQRMDEYIRVCHRVEESEAHEGCAYISIGSEREGISSGVTKI